MKKTNERKAPALSVIVDHLVKVFNDSEMLTEYERPGFLIYDGVCGWCGVMSPLSRDAMVKEYGAEIVEAAERIARETLSQSGRDYESTNHAGYMKQAEQHRADGSPIPGEGAFIFAATSGLKQTGRGLPGEIEFLAQDAANGELRAPQLCKVERVYQISAEDFGRQNFDDELVAGARSRGEYFPGGGQNDDDWEDPSGREKYKTWYTLTAAVVCKETGVWYLINSEGCSYARYILAPETWPTMYADLVQQAVEKMHRQEEEEKAEKERARAERLAAYQKRCEKWAPLMQDLTGLISAKKEAISSGWSSKEYKAAHRALQSARRKNIKAMILAAFPGLSISIREGGGFGATYTVYYTDGPTLEEMRAAVDLDLFTMTAIDFDGMTDCSEDIHAEFTDFAAKYFGMDFGSVEIHRDGGDQRDAMVDQLRTVFPERDPHALDRFSPEELSKAAEALGVSPDAVHPGINYPASLSDLAWWAWNVKSFPIAG